MEEYKFLLDIAIILAMTKSFSLVSKKFNMPPVVGALIAGIILCRLPERFYIYNKIEVLSYMLITPVVIMVLVTTLLSPIILKILFAK